MTPRRLLLLTFLVSGLLLGVQVGADATPTPVGHRARHYPDLWHTNENTLLALRWDATKKVACESDTWRLADDQGRASQGRSVIFHDTTIRRVVSDASRERVGLADTTPVNRITWAQWRRLRTTGGERMPTLNQWIRVAVRRHVPCMIEMFWLPDNPTHVADLIGNAPISFYRPPQASNGCSLAALNVMRDLGLSTGVKVINPWACPALPAWTAAQGHDYVTLRGKFSTDDPALVASYHAQGIEVGNMNSKGKASWRRFVKAGLDFIIARRPDRLKEWLS